MNPLRMKGQPAELKIEGAERSVKVEVYKTEDAGVLWVKIVPLAEVTHG